MFSGQGGSKANTSLPSEALAETFSQALAAKALVVAEGGSRGHGFMGGTSDANPPRETQTPYTPPQHFLLTRGTYPTLEPGRMAN